MIWRTTVFIFFLCVFFFTTPLAFAQSPQPHFTTFINQVRGAECCSPGGKNELEFQLSTAEELELPMTWVVRYDALIDPSFQPLLERIQKQGSEVGVFLEITPRLAQDAGVAYQATPENWYEAQHAYPVGYSPEDRRKLVDTVMKAYQQLFDTWPATTTAWVIDTPTLEYLHTQYGVQAHQITREQWGTDSYTLDGGMPHEPYFGSSRWAFIPAASASGTQPLILRQTIADPLWNYGDPTSSRTSQPNDYRLRERGFQYFEHLFLQAHTQPVSPATFALLGLENSMPTIDQQEWQRQAEFVARWREQAAENEVLTAAQLAEWKWQHPQLAVSVTHGQDQASGSQRQAWWITTPHYRLRLRAEDQLLALTDLRLYSPELTDPYTAEPARRHAYWISPFVLAGHRFWHQGGTDSFQTLFPDSWIQRPEERLEPGRIILTESAYLDTLTLTRSGDTIELRERDRVVLRATPEGFWVPSIASWKNQNSLLDKHVHQAIWRTTQKQEIWGFRRDHRDGGEWWQPFLESDHFASEREQHYPFLFPELRPRALAPHTTTLITTNHFAQAGRNPVRLALFPRDEGGYPVALQSTPSATVDADDKQTKIVVQKPDGDEGMFFIDISRDVPGRVAFAVQAEGFRQEGIAIFAPRCTDQWRECLRHPHWWWWDLQNRIRDRWRLWQSHQQAQKNL